MRSPWFVLVIIFVIAFPANTFASDLQYYFRYKGTVASLIEKYQFLQNECAEKTNDDCVNVETHARNLLIQKATAYKEYSDGVIGNFVSVFPGALSNETKIALEQHNSTILEARFLASYAQTQNLPELEKTLNGLLKKNASVINLLSVTFHVHKTKQVHTSLVKTQASLEKEVELAADGDLDVGVAKKHLRAAEKNLKNAQKLLEKNEKQIEGSNSSTAPAEIQKNITLIYTELLEANQNMLKASQILARFAERSYW